MIYDVVVIGGGPGGMSAAIWCRRLNLTVMLLEGGALLGGQLREINGPVIDYPGLRPANGEEMAGAFTSHLMAMSVPVSLGSPVRTLEAATGRVWIPGKMIMARRIILATGARPRLLEVPGEAEKHTRGEVYRGSLHRHLFTGRNVVVVGGGDRAVQNALMLAEAGAAVTLIHHSTRFRARPDFQAAVRANPHITILAPATVTAILGTHRVEGVEVVGPRSRRVIPAAAVFVYIGMETNAHLVRHQVAFTDEGRVAVDAEGRTSRPRLFAVGDVCTPPPYAGIATAVAGGMKAAKTIALELGQGGEWAG